MIRRIKKQLTPGFVLGLIALIVAVGGSSFAIAQSGKKKQTLRTRFGGATKQVVQTVRIPPFGENGGNADFLISCPSNPKLGPGVAIGGGVTDPEGAVEARSLFALEEKTDGPGPSGTGTWLFQFDNDSGSERQVQLRVICTFSKLNTKRG